MDHGAALAIKAREYAELHAFDGFNDEDRAMLERIQASSERRRSERLAALEQEGVQAPALNNQAGPHDGAPEQEDEDMQLE
ncbi:hypothetical protein CYMTET_13243 [Cymbomonas tetramitiformis]|uniref:Uncharacterized protein n=1 Tax=Cymbomonas tetramitiformis TaxID=36881 RepID=A0AAE0GII8_9CHLO|nr:hypothetical protein CYMTET_13243 [Cymbomonas tetramitiformis]